MLTTGRMAVTTRAVLLDEIWSIVKDATVAVLVTLPELRAVIERVTVATAPLAMLPKAQLTAPLVLTQLPSVVVTELKPMLAGTRLVRVAPIAASGPRLVTLS